MGQTIRSRLAGNTRRNDLNLHVSERRTVSERIGPANQLVVIGKCIKTDLCRLRLGEQWAVIVIARRSDRFNRDDSLPETIIECGRQVDRSFNHFV